MPHPGRGALLLVNCPEVAALFFARSPEEDNLALLGYKSEEHASLVNYPHDVATLFFAGCLLPKGQAVSSA